MKIKATWTAILTFLGLAADKEHTLTEEHVEKINTGLQNSAEKIVGLEKDLATAKTANDIAVKNSADIQKKLDAAEKTIEEQKEAIDALKTNPKNDIDLGTKGKDGFEKTDLVKTIEENFEDTAACLRAMGEAGYKSHIKV